MNGFGGHRVLPAALAFCHWLTVSQKTTTTPCAANITINKTQRYYWQCKQDATIPAEAKAATEAYQKAAADAKKAEADKKAGSGSAAEADKKKADDAADKKEQPKKEQPKKEQPKPAAKPLVDWAQCGGINGRPDGKDAVWADAACPDGFECVRQDECVLLFFVSWLFG
jgi:hypothetical protein